MSDNLAEKEEEKKNTPPRRSVKKLLLRKRKKVPVPQNVLSVTSSDGRVIFELHRA